MLAVSATAAALLAVRAGAPSAAAPSSLAVVSTTASSAHLTWTPPPGPGGGSRPLILQRQYEVPSHKGQWFTVAELAPTATHFTAPGLLERQRYTFRVCAEELADCSGSASGTTQAVASATPRGFIIADTNATFPRQGEGTIIRDGSQLYYFYARYTNGHDVGASVITYRTSTTSGDSWSEPRPAITPNDGKGRANACAVTLGPGHILLSYFVGVNHSSAVRVYRHTEDGGKSWGPESLLTDGSFTYMTGAHDRMRILSSGRTFSAKHFSSLSPFRPDLVYLAEQVSSSWSTRTTARAACPSSPCTPSCTSATTRGQAGSARRSRSRRT